MQKLGQRWHTANYSYILRDIWCLLEWLIKHNTCITPSQDTQKCLNVHIKLLARHGKQKQLLKMNFLAISHQFRTIQFSHLTCHYTAIPQYYTVQYLYSSCKTCVFSTMLNGCRQRHVVSIVGLQKDGCKEFVCSVILQLETHMTFLDSMKF